MNARQPDLPDAPPVPSGPVSEADHHCDVLVVGGGIHGAGVARDLAGRGWRVLLCEQGDLAEHTSSASGKLLQGGLAQLAQGEIGPVRKALGERERLMRAAPHVTWPMRLVLPHDPALRSAWAVRLGLWLYDHLAPREFLSACETVSLPRSPLGAALQSTWGKAFVYTDGWVDDARLVTLCALDAAEQGALVMTRTRCTTAQPHAQGWRATLVHHDAHSGAETHRVTVQARAVVNAAGPWAEQVLRGLMQGAPASASPMRQLKGSHIVVPRCFEHDHGYAFQAPGQRLVFALPYERDFTLIGSTEQVHVGDPASVTVEPEEVLDLCQQASRYFKRTLYPGDVVWQFAGVRAFPQEASGAAKAEVRASQRLQGQAKPAPWLTVWGGSLTTFRLQAEQAADQVGDLLGERRHSWTADAPLPGGQLTDLIDDNDSVNPVADMLAFQARLRQRHPWLDLPLMRRWSRAYGSRVLRLLEGVQGRSDLGLEVAPDLYEAELYYLRRHEWALTADDVLWRRSKLGLRYSPAQRQAVSDWFRAQSRSGRTQGFLHSDMSREAR